MHKMTDEEITAKHKRIRGSNELKYPPNESRCRIGCGASHDRVTTGTGEKLIEHRCFLAVAHEGDCEFSSACGDLQAPRESLAA